MRLILSSRRIGSRNQVVGADSLHNLAVVEGSPDNSQRGCVGDAKVLLILSQPFEVLEAVESRVERVRRRVLAYVIVCQTHITAASRASKGRQKLGPILNQGGRGRHRWVEVRAPIVGHLDAL